MKLNHIYTASNLEILKTFPDNSLDSVVTDSPYGLGKEPDPIKLIQAWIDHGYLEIQGSGFMSKKWDAFVPQPIFWKEVFRVLKPGGYCLSFFGTRTYDWGVLAMRLAGFEVRDCIQWLYGCLSEDTEILTINGWERYHKNIASNPVLCYNLDKDTFEFHLPTKEFIYENKHPAYNIKSDFTDQIVSRNHRVIIERDGRKVFAFAETLQQYESIPFLENLQCLPETIQNIHEGTSITKQNLLRKMQNKISIVSQEGETTGENSQENKIKMCILQQAIRTQTKRIKEAQKYILQLFMQSESTHRTFASILCKWEGNKKSKEGTQRREKSSMERRRNLFQNSWKLYWSKIRTLSEKISKNVTERWLRDGASTNNGAVIKKMFAKDRSSSSQGSQSTQQRIIKSDVIQKQPGTQTIRSTRAKITKIEYTGKVWCIEVPTGAFVARRNGKIFVTGNSGFPKSLDISKAIDAKFGAERKIIGTNKNARKASGKINIVKKNGAGTLTESNSPEAKRFEGYGTNLKPAVEPIVVCRKPISESTIADNVLKYGTGGINIDATRIPTEELWHRNNEGRGKTFHGQEYTERGNTEQNELGRFPSNVILDEESAKLLDQQSGQLRSGDNNTRTKPSSGYNGGIGFAGDNQVSYGDNGGASRFFYIAKASQYERNLGCEKLEAQTQGHSEKDRCKKCGGRIHQNPDRPSACKCEIPEREHLSATGNSHPTVKPVALMRNLVKLVTPKGGTILDPFLGSGTTAIAARIEGFNFIGIEQDEHSVKIAEARIKNYKKYIFLESKDRPDPVPENQTDLFTETE